MNPTAKREEEEDGKRKNMGVVSKENAKRHFFSPQHFGAIFSRQNTARLSVAPFAV